MGTVCFILKRILVSFCFEMTLPTVRVKGVLFLLTLKFAVNHVVSFLEAQRNDELERTLEMNLSLVILQTKKWYARELKRLSKVTDFLAKSELKSVFALFCLQCYFPTIYSPILQLYSPIMSVTKKKKKHSSPVGYLVFQPVVSAAKFSILYITQVMLTVFCGVQLMKTKRIAYLSSLCIRIY